MSGYRSNSRHGVRRHKQLEQNREMPIHNGIISEKSSSADLETACQQDLLIRFLVIFQKFLIGLLELIATVKYYDKETLLVNDEYLVSLPPESLGAYKHIDEWRYYSSLTPGDKRNEIILNNAKQYETVYGYNIITLLPKILRCKPENLLANLPDSIIGKLTFYQRFIFCEKPMHYRVAIPENQFPIIKGNDIFSVLQNCYPVVAGYKEFAQYPYYAENGDIILILLEFFNKKRERVRVPITAWKFVNHHARSTTFYDTLNMAPPYPLYNLPSIVDNRNNVENVLIFYNESSARCIIQEHPWFIKKNLCTSYLIVQGTNFRPLKGFNSFIVPEESKAGYQKAYAVYNEVIKHCSNVCFTLPECANTADQFWEDLSPSNLENAINNPVSIKEFGRHALSKYGIQPPEGLLPKAISLDDIPNLDVKEMLLKGALALGHQATIVAPRGTGKSMLMLYLAVCLILKTEGLNGQICPFRQYTVLIFDYELAGPDIRERFNNIFEAMKLTEEQIAYANANIRIRSAIDEKTDLHLDTEEGWASVLPDINEADIIIVDSLHWAFPSAMSTEMGGTKILNDRYKWCKQRNKSLIVVDHPSKTGNSPFGSIGKDIGLDAVFFMKKAKGSTITIDITKNRHFSDENTSWATFKLSDIIIATNSPKQELFSDDTVFTGDTDDLNIEVVKTMDDVSPKNPQKVEEIVNSILALRAQYPNEIKSDFVRWVEHENIAKRTKAYEVIKTLEKADKIYFSK